VVLATEPATTASSHAPSVTPAFSSVWLGSSSGFTADSCSSVGSLPPVVEH
jgi:hypothetical protein